VTNSPMLSVPSKLRRGGKKSDEWEYIDGGRDLLNYMSKALGLKDLGDSRVLDMGCGTKFTQAILNYNIPVGEYIGVDVYGEMIDFLRSSTDDPRFSFHHVDTHNDMYNPHGEKLSENTAITIDEHSCDVICLFSVFTHLAPADYTNMLKLMRRFASDDAKLMYTLYLDEVTNNGHGLIEQIALEAGKPYQPSGEPFRDAFPGKPLQWALYTRDYALELIQGSGWKVAEICLPNECAQHHIICSPE
jgi:SAM-dependent methyltransferase